MFNRLVSALFRFVIWLLIINLLCLFLEDVDYVIVVAVSFVIGNLSQLLENQWSK